MFTTFRSKLYRDSIDVQSKAADNPLPLYTREPTFSLTSPSTASDHKVTENNGMSVHVTLPPTSIPPYLIYMITNVCLLTAEKVRPEIKAKSSLSRGRGTYTNSDGECKVMVALLGLWYHLKVLSRHLVIMLIL